MKSIRDYIGETQKRLEEEGIKLPRETIYKLVNNFWRAIMCAMRFNREIALHNHFFIYPHSRQMAMKYKKQRASKRKPPVKNEKSKLQSCN